MPQEPWLWALAIVVGGGVVALALVLGGWVEVSLQPLSLKFRRKAAERSDRISLLKQAEIENAEIGRAVGMEREVGRATPEQDNALDVSVAEGVKISGSKIGEIAGIGVRGSPAPSPTPKSDGRTGGGPTPPG